MITVNNLLDFMWELAPEELKEPWDNVGLLVGREGNPVTKVLTALDITPSVIEEAKEFGAELIIAHHPLIWDTYRHVNDTVFQQEKVISLVESGIAAICMHTNLDEAVDGVDDTLVEILGLTSIDHLAEGKVGHICQLSAPVSLRDFLSDVKERLGANGLRFVDSGKPVYKVATGCGSCGDYLLDAVKAGCDTFVTGDVKHNVFLDAQGMGINLVDAGHFSTENPIVHKITLKIAERFPELQVYESKTMTQPEEFFV